MTSSGVHPSRVLVNLEKYCDANGLTVKVGNTKIMIFRSGGEILDRDLKRFKFKGEIIGVVSKFVYLEVTLSASSLGCGAAKDAVHKGKAAALEIITILKRLKANPWNSINKLYRSMVTSVVLYTSAC